MAARESLPYPISWNLDGTLPFGDWTKDCGLSQCVTRRHKQDGYAFVTVIDCKVGIAEGPRRGIQYRYMRHAAERCHFVFDGATFAPCDEVWESNHWLTDSPNERLQPNDYVYFVQSNRGGPIKIGKAQHPQSRMKSLQIGSPFPLVFLAVTPNVDHRFERELHKRFSEYRLHGEWFEPCEELLELIDRLKSQEATP